MFNIALIIAKYHSMAIFIVQDRNIVMIIAIEQNHCNTYY